MVLMMRVGRQLAGRLLAFSAYCCEKSLAFILWLATAGGFAIAASCYELNQDVVIRRGSSMWRPFFRGTNPHVRLAFIRQPCA
jgi:hypothetical protein